MILATATLLGLSLRGAACADNHLHTRHAHEYLERREYPQVPLTPPYRPLVWGDLNVIHTTDTHGWLLGHQKLSWAEPYYSGDLGEFFSFVTHMKQVAIDKDVDLLLIDSGDLHDGTGLSDGYPLGGVDAYESNKFLERLPYDLMTIGNHELYIYADTYDMYTNFVPHLAGRYLTSNVNITVFNSDGEPESVPVGSRYTKFTTRKGRRITSLGVIFNFTQNDVNTTVQTVDNMVREQWFIEAIAEEPDVFVLIGHMPVSNDSWPTVFNAVRAVHPLTPILILGGHTHIRDCRQYDGRSMALESGRYMETIGADLDAAKDNQDNITFTRRYLDQNRVTYEYHTQTSNQTFDTDDGRSISYGLEALAACFNLSYLYGTAHQDYTMNQNPYPSNGSLLSLFIEDAVPYALAINNTRDSIPNIIIINSWAIRFDLFKGSFTKNDQLTIMQYKDSFLYIANVTSGIANQVLPAMNKPTATKRKRDETGILSREINDTRDSDLLEEIDHRPGVSGREATSGNWTFGYVTRDSCPDADKADDTLHTALPYYTAPYYIGSNPPNVTADTPIDVVFLNYLGKEIIDILNSLQKDKNYTMNDVSSYSPTLTDEILGLYALAMWN
ncbi:Metallo-dependent phosphatase-like protein [Suillus placidus]|uniref:Metallo-dependent phosphatase-like protein n=1 Tax=Suillus placidus TaxID=48579 RepID=A0A9P7D118_9AGAM|nr:Metallo-dependent phosphatase-like protein [Suillus placidus]